MKINPFIIISFLLSIQSTLIKSQDSYFNQRNNTLLYHNPSFTGILENTSLHTGMNFSRVMTINNLSTFTSFEKPVEKWNSAFGITHHLSSGNSVYVLQDLGLNYAYKLKLSEKYTWRFGGKAELRNIYVDWDQLTFGDQIDPRYGFVYETSSLKGNKNNLRSRFALGTSLIHEKWILGYAYLNINRSRETFTSRSSPWHQIQFTGQLFKKSSSGLLINVDYLVNQYEQIASLSLVYHTQHLRFGIGINEYEFPNLMLGTQFDRWRMSYSLGLTTRNLNYQFWGIHELHFSYLFGKKDNLKQAPRIIWNNF